jgi:hypothetical protein
MTADEVIAFLTGLPPAARPAYVDYALAHARARAAS